MSTGRRCSCNAISAIRADRFEERTAANVATASTSVPAPVASEEIVDQSSTDLSLPPVARARQAFDAPANGITC